MSLWTPSGEHPVREEVSRQVPEPSGPGGGVPGGGAEEQLEMEAGFDALRQQLADAPADAVVANHCYGLFELAAVYLSQSPPRLDGARLAIDALGYLVDGLGGRLGEAHQSLRDALGQLRLAYVQISSASQGTGLGMAEEQSGPGQEAPRGP